jgi:Tfp pilus assembly protein PilV
MNKRNSHSSRRGQYGISLLVVLIALVIIGFAAIALLRSSDTGTLIMGNLGFQKTALATGDASTEAAITWLTANAAGATLFDDGPAADPGPPVVLATGYYATTADNCDLTGTRTPNVAADDINWTGADPGGACNMDAITVAPAGIAPGFTVRYVVNRVCNAEGDPNSLVAADGVTPMSCSRLGAGVSEGSTRGGASYGNLPLTGEAQTYYRITTRIDGPRNTVRYMQALVVI